MDEEDLVLLGVLSIGAPTGLGLSFTALSPLVIGGIVAAVPVILVAAYLMCKEGCSKKGLFNMAVAAASAAAIGVGLAAAGNCYFSWCNAWNGLCSFNRCGNRFVAVEVGNDIISPRIEHFSSKGKGCEPV
ncbi:MAG: hypothetical protein ABS808_04135 [Wolbachia endosymbiont of Polyergus mexicanus]|uniref:Uncharacterized protein n=1 Tax=Wolbachia endosymbiont of Polyergus mexicanus TaxID=3171167 RepID=A0AAU7YJB6_9RICK